MDSSLKDESFALRSRRKTQSSFCAAELELAIPLACERRRENAQIASKMDETISKERR